MENYNENSDQFYLEKASITKAILHLSVPMMLGMSVGVIYNIINAFFIGFTHDTTVVSRNIWTSNNYFIDGSWQYLGSRWWNLYI